jgi:ribosomal protein S12 methylthiotransferase accessory factor YcaO
MTIGVVAVILLIIVVAVAAQAQRRKSAPSEAEMAQTLRRHLLETMPEEGTLVVMDMPMSGAVVSVMSSSLGDASIYVSTGGGFVGGAAHENVRTAAQAFVEEILRQRATFTETTDFSYPAESNIRFFLRTKEGVFVGEAPQEALMSGTVPLSSAFARAQDVITKVRTV